MGDRPDIMEADLESLISFEDGVLLDVFELSDKDDSQGMEESNENSMEDNGCAQENGDTESSDDERSVENIKHSKKFERNSLHSDNRPGKLIDLDNPEVYEGALDCNSAYSTKEIRITKTELTISTHLQQTA